MERTVTFGVDSGANLSASPPHLTQRRDRPRKCGPKKAMRDRTGEIVKDIGDKYLVLKGPLGDTFFRNRRLYQFSGTCCPCRRWSALEAKSRSRRTSRTCGIQGPDGGNASAESVERTWTAHWSRDGTGGGTWSGRASQKMPWHEHRKLIMSWQRQPRNGRRRRSGTDRLVRQQCDAKNIAEHTPYRAWCQSLADVAQTRMRRESGLRDLLLFGVDCGYFWSRSAENAGDVVEAEDGGG